MTRKRNKNVVTLHTEAGNRILKSLREVQAWMHEGGKLTVNHWTPEKGMVREEMTFDEWEAHMRSPVSFKKPDEPSP